MVDYIPQYTYVAMGTNCSRPHVLDRMSASVRGDFTQTGIIKKKMFHLMFLQVDLIATITVLPRSLI